MVDHASLIFHQLNLSLKYIDKKNNRRKLHIESLIAEQYYKVELYRPAILYLHDITMVLSYEGWIQIAISYLYQQLDCAIHLGELQEILHISMILYSKEGSFYLDIHKKDQLHKDIFHILNAASLWSISSPSRADSSSAKSSYDASPMSRSRSVSSTPRSPSSSYDSVPTYLPVTKRPEYGSFATSDHPCQYMLPNNYTIHMHQPASNNQHCSNPLIVYNDSSMMSNSSSSSLKSLSTNYVYNPKFFDISIKFENITVDINQEVQVNITMKSLLQRSCMFHEMIIYFCNQSLLITFHHDMSCGLGDTNGGIHITSEEFHEKRKSSDDSNHWNYHAPIIFKPGQESIFTFPIMINEKAIQKLKSSLLYDAIFFIERIELVCIHSIPSKYASNIHLSPYSLDIPSIDENEEISQHKVVLAIHISPDGMSKSRESQLSSGSATSTVTAPIKPWSMKEITSLFHMPRDSLLQVLKPTSHVTLVYPNPNDISSSTVTLLQGPLQRLNIIFHTNIDEILDGKIYVSSDYSPINQDDYLFWYPSSNDTRSSLDEIIFHPMVLNASMQPAQPFLLPSNPSQTYFNFPLFLRSELIGQFKIKLKLEYRCQETLLIPIMKEFEMKINFSRPLQVNFNVMSQCEALCGITKESAVSTILHHDIITVSSSLLCLDSLDMEIDILALELRLNTETIPFQSNKNESFLTSTSNSNKYNADSPMNRSRDLKSIDSNPSKKGNDLCLSSFQFIDRENKSNTYNLLHNKGMIPSDLQPNDANRGSNSTIAVSESISLQRGERYVNSTNITCIEQDLQTVNPSNESLAALSLQSFDKTPSDRFKMSIGNVYVYWRLNDKNLLQPLDIASFLKARNILPLSLGTNPSNLGIVDKSTSIRKASIDKNPSNWLPSLDHKDKMSWNEGNSIDNPSREEALNTNISITRLCSMIFSIPPVQVDHDR